MLRLRVALVLCTALVVIAGALAGWRISVRFVRGDIDGRGLEAPRLVMGLSSEPGPVTVAAGGVPGARRGGHSMVLAVTPSADRPAGRPPVAAAGAAGPRRALLSLPAGLHMTFRRTWRPLIYEIRAPHVKQPAPLVCVPCTAQNRALDRADSQAASRDRMFRNTIAPAIVTLSGAGQITLMEWAP